jgi:hypothetical protein
MPPVADQRSQAARSDIAELIESLDKLGYQLRYETQPSQLQASSIDTIKSSLIPIVRHSNDLWLDQCTALLPAMDNYI